MHQSQNTFSQVIIRHLILVLVAIGLAIGLYLVFQNTSTVTAGIIALGLAHILAVAGIVYFGRSLLRKLFRKMHGISDAEASQHPQTEGATINWPTFYDLLVKAIFLGKEQRFREAVVDLAEIRPGERVLDVGCGTGTFTIIAKQKVNGAQVIARDASPEMIAKARQAATKAGVNVDFAIGLAESIDFPDASFDVVMNSFMVHHLPGDLKARAFAEMYRVLKPGGRLQIVDFEPPKKGMVWLILRPLLGAGMLQIDNSTNLPLLKKAGFTGVTIGRGGHPLATLIAAIKAS